MKPGHNALLSIEVQWPQDISDEHRYYPEIRIIDAVSNQTVVTLELTENQWLRLCHGTYLSNIEGWLAPEHLRANLGKRFEHSSVIAPKELSWTHHREGEITRPGEDMKEWAEATVQELNLALPASQNWTDWNLYQSNKGWELQLRRWVAISDATATRVDSPEET